MSLDSVNNRNIFGQTTTSYSNPNTGATIGFIVGIVVGLPILICCSAYMCLLCAACVDRKRAKRLSRRTCRDISRPSPLSGNTTTATPALARPAGGSTQPPRGAQLLTAPPAHDVFRIQRDSSSVRGLFRLGSNPTPPGKNADYFLFTVDRTSPTWLNDLFALYCRTPIEDLRKLTKVSFLGEAGVDGGGLSREFFNLTFKTLCRDFINSRSLWCGEIGHLIPSIDHRLVESRAFWFLGVLIAQAVNRKCRGPSGLCPAVRKFLSLDAKMKELVSCQQLLTLDDLVDTNLKSALYRLQTKQRLNGIESACVEHWLTESSCSFKMTNSNLSEAIQRILCYYVFDSRMSQLQAIAEGIRDVGLRTLDGIVLDVDRMFPVDIKLTLSDVINGFDLKPSVSAQTRTKEYFLRYCADINDGLIGDMTLEDLLTFIFGAPYFPSMSPIGVKFSPADADHSLPVSHLCSSEFILPTVHKNYDDFRDAMTKAIQYSGVGFGLV